MSRHSSVSGPYPAGAADGDVPRPYGHLAYVRAQVQLDVAALLEALLERLPMSEGVAGRSTAAAKASHLGSARRLREATQR